MSVEERIAAALEGLGYPIAADAYAGEAGQYFVYQYDTAPDAFADDGPQCELFLVQVHYYCPLGTSVAELGGQVKRRLFSAGFSWPAMETVAGGETGHRIFKCERMEKAGSDEPA